MNKVHYFFLFVLLKEIITQDPVTYITSQCDTSNCPPAQGVCYMDRCNCLQGFKTFNTEGESFIYCNYPQKSRWIPFLLEFFIPIGIGHFYVGNFGLGIMKIFLAFFPACALKFFGWKPSDATNASAGVLCGMVVICCLGLAYGAMAIIDVICYAFGLYTDGNGVELA